ncbi:MULTISPECIES: ABC transporter permease [unclassified Paenibacillus]|uniref:ABC transporter permease n=1 Tax=unclassified Paenibacillus TaxID=185978 RepID=UPI0024058198|nr:MULTISPECIES: ABC transporter permease [unclassified Paenibacillus]MDF9842591.1 ribose transport system permease protein [Paenibacillus sp. PastF-2]MDF9849202.1 ribose transport system permease protein [Paenibacillus sp. PastM-2]MDF9855751.1 ribose transport system permease protein [Paenibacillus sp. PastF-1]MDH6481045.1 ribose transport system permease protein [Paenibacillus sp. PastH-2]MDH6508443.1 ribose transport system permease protein [Paenibacillus sp. PastM-3]
MTTWTSRLPFKSGTLLVQLVLLLFILILFSFLSPYFLSVTNFMNVLNQMVEVGLIAIPMTMIIISGAMDLSVGSILAFSAVSMGVAFERGYNIWVCVIFGLLAGLLCGAINGYLIARHRMQAIVVTIGMLVMLRGLVYVVNEGRPISGFPDSFYFLGQEYIAGIPFNAIVLVVMFLIASFFMKKTRFGTYIYGIGNNEEVVRFSGISVVRVRFILFMLSGLFSALAGVFLVSRLASAEATSGTNIELDVITATLIGGTHIFGGRGSLTGTFVGLLIIVFLRNGLNLLGVSVLYQAVILGALLLLAVANKKISGE